MYSRNRTPSGEDRYKSNIPPVYSGNRFRYIRQEEPDGIQASDERAANRTAYRTPENDEQASAISEESAAACLETSQAESKRTQPEPQVCGEEGAESHSGGLPELISGIGQEELLLIALLLLLCAEHDRSMDIIIILLLLIGIH